VLRSILELLHLNAKQKGLQLTSFVAPDVPSYLLGDPGRWRQVLTNLLGNAIKFTKAGRVDVRLTVAFADDGQALLKTEVIDTGIGIAADKVSLLFKPFSQVDASTTREFGGTGLGLSICKHLAELMGGEIGVSSVLGQGSHFWFTVRMPVAEQEEMPVISARAESIVSNRSLFILLVEDNVINQKVAVEMLKKLGHRVDVVGNGQEAIDQLSIIDYDLVLMDCQMPVMDGVTATRQIRAGVTEVRRATVPIVAFSANMTADDQQACLLSGMNGFIAKPMQLSDLLAVLQKYESPITLDWMAGANGQG